MEKITDWAVFWRELVEMRARGFREETEKNSDHWTGRAHKFQEGVSRRWQQKDSSREFILSQTSAESTLLDIGAGTGAWALLLAPRVRRVTAIDPSDAMIAVMRENIARQNIQNISIVKGSWPEVDVEQHDFSFCSHAMYGCPELPAFIRKMESCTRRTCFLLMRAPSLDSIQSEASRYLWGHPLDGPNFVVAYNVLLQMGIYANVSMENTGLWASRTSPSLESALTRLKRFMGFIDSSEHDSFFMDILRRRLVWKDGSYAWPQEMRSALIYWDVTNSI